MSVFRVILVRIFPHSDWIRRDNLTICQNVAREERLQLNKEKNDGFSLLSEGDLGLLQHPRWITLYIQDAAQSAPSWILQQS